MRKRKFLIGVCVLLTFLGVAILAIRSGIYEFGTEFSPDVFQHRMYHRYWLMGIPVTRKIYEGKKWALDEYLHARGYVPPYTSHVRRPDVVMSLAGHTLNIEERRAASSPSEPAWYLVQSFPPGCRDAVGNYYTFCLGGLRTFPSERHKWIAWSEAHPDIARIFWPRVVALVREDKLDKAELLLYLAEGCSTLKEFNDECASEGLDK